MAAALADFEVEGPDTTLPFLRHVLSAEDFRAGRFNTRWLEAFAPSFQALPA
jgi:acetyl-CoA carboxylase, biotin carboxylase subunit